MSNSLEERVRQMEERLRELENREAIRGVLSRYAKALDERDVSALSPLWSRDAELVVNPWGYAFKGRQAIMDFYTEYFKGEWKEPRHNRANETIERDGDGYRVFSYFHETLAHGSFSVMGWGNVGGPLCAGGRPMEDRPSRDQRDGACARGQGLGWRGQDHAVVRWSSAFSEAARANSVVALG